MRALLARAGVITVVNLDMVAKSVGIIGCFLFLVSFISPFYHVMPIGVIEQDVSIYYSSFKSDVHFYHTSQFRGTVQYWFSDYWFNYRYGSARGFSWVFISMFIAQVLTFATCIASILFNRRILALAPIVLSLTVTALMIHASTYLSEKILGAGLISYEQGYWLTYPSTISFLLAFIMNSVARKKKQVFLAKQV